MVIAGGGTGGHFFPGLAVAQEAVRQGASAIFVGSNTGIEARVAPQRGFRFVPLDIHGVRGVGWRGALRFAAQLPVALLAAWRVLGEHRADIVLGLGGYGSVPVVVAAWLRRVPAVLMEQNVHPGLANRILSRLARRVCTTFAESAEFFPAGKAIRTGNPVRRLESSTRPDPSRFSLLVFGGSQGARSVNRVVTEAVGQLQPRLPELSIVHQTGEADRLSVDEQYRARGIDARVSAFIEDMAAAYGSADLVVCRAGATTLAELAMVGKPAILIPYPYAADDHQRHNAEAMTAHRAAEMILEKDLSPEHLAERIFYYSQHRAQLAAMAQAAADLAAPAATAEVLRVCRELVRRGH